MRALCVIMCLGLSACSGKFEETRAQRAHVIYNVGTYDFTETCNDDAYETTGVNITKERFVFQDAGCDIIGLGTSQDPLGAELTLGNCPGPKADKTVILETQDNDDIYLHGWNESPLRLFKCQDITLKHN